MGHVHPSDKYLESCVLFLNDKLKKMFVQFECNHFFLVHLLIIFKYKFEVFIFRIERLRLLIKMPLKHNGRQGHRESQYS